MNFLFKRAVLKIQVPKLQEFFFQKMCWKQKLYFFNCAKKWENKIAYYKFLKFYSYFCINTKSTSSYVHFCVIFLELKKLVETTKKLIIRIVCSALVGSFFLLCYYCSFYEWAQVKDFLNGDPKVSRFSQKSRISVKIGQKGWGIWSPPIYMGT